MHLFPAYRVRVEKERERERSALFPFVGCSSHRWSSSSFPLLSPVDAHVHAIFMEHAFNPRLREWEEGKQGSSRRDSFWISRKWKNRIKMTTLAGFARASIPPDLMNSTLLERFPLHLSLSLTRASSSKGSSGIDRRASHVCASFPAAFLLSTTTHHCKCIDCCHSDRERERERITCRKVEGRVR